MNASSTAEIGWFNYPQVFLGFLLRQHIKVRRELSHLIRKNIGIWHYIVDATASELLLHLHNIKAQSVLPCYLIAWGEVIDPLIFIQTFIKERFAGRGRPEDVPIVRVREAKIVCFQKTSHQFCITSQNFVKEFTRLFITWSRSIAKRLSWRKIVQ